MQVTLTARWTSEIMRMTEATFEGGLTVPAWLNSFASAAAAYIHGVDVLSPLGCHCYHNRARDEYELTVFASRTQVVAGTWTAAKSAAISKLK